MKEANLKMLLAVRFQFYDILEKGKTMETVKGPVVARDSREGRRHE